MTTPSAVGLSGRDNINFQLLRRHTSLASRCEQFLLWLYLQCIACVDDTPHRGIIVNFLNTHQTTL